MLRDHASEDEAAKDKGEDCDANACCGGKEPDEEDECSNADAEPRGDVDLGEHIVFLAVEALFRVRLTVYPLIQVIDFKESRSTFRDAHLV